MLPRPRVVWRKVQPVLLGLLLVVLLLLTLSFLMLLAPVWITAALHWHISERRFLRRLRGGGRVLTRAELEQHVGAQRGTLLLEAEREFGVVQRVWWLPDRLVKLYPDAPWATVEDLRRVPAGEDGLFEVSQRCRHWCEHYLPKLAGSAHLVEVPPEALWAWLDRAAPTPQTAAVVPYPALSGRVKRAAR
jgi:hypothetical protein